MLILLFLIINCFVFRVEGYDRQLLQCDGSTYKGSGICARLHLSKSICDSISVSHDSVS